MRCRDSTLRLEPVAERRGGGLYCKFRVWSGFSRAPVGRWSSAELSRYNVIDELCLARS